MIRHGFEKSLGREAADAPFLDALWSVWWGGACYTRREPDLAKQKKGTDVHLYLHAVGGKPVVAQEKIRRHDYGDVLLEYLSANTTGDPGWALKVPAQARVVLYGIAPSRRALLFPYTSLVLATRDNLELWRRKYKDGPPIWNQGFCEAYYALNVAVPTRIVFEAIDKQHWLQPCAQCKRQVLWTQIRGGAPVTGCFKCMPWGIHPARITLPK
jgi:hypothetical protein